MPEIHAVLCDLDGTLVDTEGLHVAAWRTIAENYKLELTEGWDSDYVGKPDIYQAEKMHALYPALPEVPRLLVERHDIYRRLLFENRDKIRFPGVEAGLRALRDAGVKLAVGTNSPIGNTSTALEAAGIDRYFDAIVAFGMVPKGKPAPDIYLEAARLVEVDPSLCAVVEDTAIGIAAGKAAGCLALGVATSYGEKELAEADKVFAGTGEALSWVLRFLSEGEKSA